MFLNASNLLSKILLWVFINLLVLGIVLFFIFNLQFNFSPNSPLLGAANERIEVVAEMIATDSNGKSRAERDEILQRYSDDYGLTFTLFANTGEQLGGRELATSDTNQRSFRNRIQTAAGTSRKFKASAAASQSSNRADDFADNLLGNRPRSGDRKRKKRKHKGFGHRFFGLNNGKWTVSQPKSLDRFGINYLGFVGFNLVSVYLESK